VKRMNMKRIGVGGALVISVLVSVVPSVAWADGADPGGVGVASGMTASAQGLAVPPADPVLAFVAPDTDLPNYSARLEVFLQATVPETWNGQPVAFLSAFDDAGGVDVLGLPTSAPKADPSNPNFVYQRFQNGVLFYNATETSTQALSF
jgi:hypothetical protein